MKIVYFIDRISTPGGMERLLVTKANYFKEVKNYDVYIITTDLKESIPYFRVNENIKIFNLDIKLGEISKQTNFLNKRKKIKELKIEYFNAIENILLKIKADFVISFFNFESDFLYKIKDGSKKIVEFHFSKEGLLLETGASRFPKLTYYYFKYLVLNRYKKVFSKYDKVLFSSKRDFKAWKRLKNADYIYNPLTIKEIIKEIPNYEEKIVIAVGRVSYQKSFEYLLEAWSYLKKDFPDWKLKIIGRRTKTDYLDSIKNKLKLNDEVVILPPTPFLKEEYLSSSIFVLSSRYEGFGLVLTEAALHGLPMVSFDCPCGPSEIINHGKDGLLAKPQDAYDLSLQLRILMKDQELIKEKGKAAKKNIRRFSEERIMPKWDVIFNELS